LGLKHEEALQKLDQRLDRLTECHEALAQSVELLKGMQEKTEKAQERAEKEIKELGRFVRIIFSDREAPLLRLEGGDEDGDDNGEELPDA